MTQSQTGMYKHCPDPVNAGQHQTIIYTNHLDKPHALLPIPQSPRKVHSSPSADIITTLTRPQSTSRPTIVTHHQTFHPSTSNSPSLGTSPASKNADRYLFAVSRLVPSTSTRCMVSPPMQRSVRGSQHKATSPMQRCRNQSA